MVGRSTSVCRDHSRHEEIPEIEYNLTVEQALELEVPYERVRKTLGWIAKFRPVALEGLMDKMEPGTKEFWAVCLVYNHYLAVTLVAVNLANRKVQMRTKEGIANGQKRKTWHCSPNPRPRIRPEVLEELARN